MYISLPQTSVCGADALRRVRVSGGSVVSEDRSAQFARRRVAGERRQWLALVGGEGLFEAGIGRGLGLRVLALRTPSAHALVAAEAAEPEQVGDAEGDRDVEAEDPPARHRLVDFGAVAVPVMAGVPRQERRRVRTVGVSKVKSR